MKAVDLGNDVLDLLLINITALLDNGMTLLEVFA